MNPAGPSDKDIWISQIKDLIRQTDERRLGFRDKKAFVDAAACAIRIRALQDALKVIGGA